MNNHSLFKTHENKHIKFYRENISIVEGVNIVQNFNLSDLKFNFKQHNLTFTHIPAGVLNQQISYGILGTSITLLVIKVKYTEVENTYNPASEKPYMEYFFEGDYKTQRGFDNLLIFTGNINSMIPQIYLSNPNAKHHANIEIMMATTDISYVITPQVLQLDSSNIDIQSLTYNNIVSDNVGTSIIIQLDSNTPLASVNLAHITNIELSGRCLIIDDSAQGTLNLFFIDQYNALQAYSLINWAISDPTNNRISSSSVADLTPPTITYAGSFTTTINLNNYPLNGTNGNNGYVITKDNLISLEIENVIDNRDGTIYIDDSNLTITRVNQALKLSSINAIGKYTLTIDVADVAGNHTTDVFVLNIIDNNPPKIILSEIGFQSYQAVISGTAGQSTNIYLQDFSLELISQQELLELLVDSIIDSSDGNIPVTTNYVTVGINLHGSNVALTQITAPGLYDITMQVTDSLNNVGNAFWENSTVELLDTHGNPFTTIQLLIENNSGPDIIINTIGNQHLYVYGGTITKTNLNNLLINEITDPKDGIISNSLLNISIFQSAISGTNGSTSGVTVVDGTNSYVFDYIPNQEVLYINQEGIYTIQIIAVDSDGLASVVDVPTIILP